MNNKVTESESKAKICGILVAVGAAVSAIALFTLVRYAIKGESPYAFTFLLRHCAAVACFTILAVGILSEKPHLFKIGLFIGAAGYVLDAYFPLMWINEDTKYYGSLSRGMGNGYFFLLLACLAAIAGFVLMGILYSDRRDMKVDNMGTIAMALIAAYIVLIVGYAIYFMHENYLTLGPYLSSYITGASTLSVVGAAGVLLMPVAFPVESAAGNTHADAYAGSNASPVAASSTLGASNKAMAEEDSFALLRKYKQLLDMEVITQEEFEEKKRDLLKL